MTTGAAGDGLLRGLFEGCISGGDMGIQRRPYHRNCNCALHKSRGRCSHPPKNTQVSYPVKRSWSESCLALITVSDSGHSPSVTSPAMGNDPTGEIPRTKSQLGLDVVRTIASISTYKPSERMRQYDDFAEFIGNGRAKNARAIWNRPLETVYISDCGEVKVVKPTLSPTLP
ncbi:Hypothetical predicted protein [Olea europaea subsp. europaea]|uniref:Uncharacterized protein n=1 Tax=Olea europaea subsp. europaea TaxID=158383 RepID=A0A8S0QUK9_OLEEU|nr:Hypothetical predicted protein [Olea europaea subsp. europaea]